MKKRVTQKGFILTKVVGTIDLSLSITSLLTLNIHFKYLEYC